MTAVVTLFDVAAERGGAALLDGRHHTALRGRQSGPDLGPEDIAVAAEDFRHRERGARQALAPSTGWVRSGTGRGSRSAGLAVEQTLVVATRR